VGLVGWLYGLELWKTIFEAFKTIEDQYEPLPNLTEHFLQASRGVVWQSIYKTALYLFLLGALLWVLQRFKGLPRVLLPGGLLALTVIDLWLFGSRYLVTFHPEDLRMDQDLKAFLQGEKEPFRVATPFFDLLNTGLLEGIENVGGNDAIVLKHYSEFINVAQQLPLEQPNLVMNIERYSPLLDLLNVRYYILPSSMRIDMAGFELGFQNHKYNVYKNTRALPRSFVVHDTRVMQERNAVLLDMTSLGFRPRSYAIIDQHIAGLPSDATLQSPVPQVLQHTFHKVAIKANLTQPGLLVLGDVYYPGWQAFVDGRETTIYRANYVMQAIFAPAGEHLVEFYYRPLSLKIGAIVSAMALVCVVGSLFWGYKRSWPGEERTASPC
jgi:hypothetical protein